MTERTNHPDFDAAPEEHRWNATLPKLAEHLKHAAYEAKGDEAWVVLPGGALVAMRIEETTFRKQLRIARRLTKPFTEKSATAWHKERTTFLEQLGCKDWTCRHGALYTPPDQVTKQPAKIEALYVDPAPLGALKAMLKCHRCGKDFEPAPDDKLYRDPTCNPCAITLGAEETAAHNAARGATHGEA